MHIIKIFSLIVFTTFLYSNSKSQIVEWARQSNGISANQGTAIGNDIIADGLGNVYVVGNANNAQFDGLNFQGQFERNFIAKYNSEGEIQWLRKISGGSNNVLTDINIDGNGDLIIAGYYSHTNSFTVLDFGPFQELGSGEDDLFVAKIDSDGDWIWTQTILSEDVLGGQLIRPNDVLVSSSGQIFISGTIDSPTATIDGQVFDTDSPALSFFFCSLNQDGELLWFKHGDGLLTDVEMSFDSEQNIIISGELRSDIIYDDVSQLERPYGARSVMVGSMNTNGGINWWKSLGHLSFNLKPDGHGLDAQNNLYLAFHQPFWVEIDGVQHSTTEVNHSLWKLSPTGEFIWQKPYYNGNEQVIAAGVLSEQILTAPNGFTYSFGLMESADFIGGPVFGEDTLGGLGQFEGYISVYDPNGDYVDVIQFVFDDDFGDFRIGEMKFDHEGNIIITGRFRELLQLDNTSLDSESNAYHMYLIKINPQEAFDLSVGLFDLKDSPYGLYPNPTTGVFFIDGLLPNQSYSYELMDPTGSIQQSGNMDFLNNSIRLRTISSNHLYFLRIKDDTRSYTHKVILNN